MCALVFGASRDALCEGIEGVMLVATDIDDEVIGNECADNALCGGTGKASDTFDVGTADEGIGLEILSDDCLDLVERHVGGMGFFGRALEALLLAVGHEGLLGGEDDALGGDAGGTHLGGVVYRGAGEGERERSETFEAHAVTAGKVLADHLLDGGDGCVDVGGVKGAACRDGINNFLECDGAFCHDTGVIDFRCLRIGIRVRVEFKGDSHSVLLV